MPSKNTLKYIELCPQERAEIVFALQMWINYIETSDVNLSAVDAANMKKPFNPLLPEQIRKLTFLHNLQTRIKNAK